MTREREGGRERGYREGEKVERGEGEERRRGRWEKERRE